MRNMALETGYFKGLTAVFKLTFIICQASGSAIALYAEGCEPTVDNIKCDIDGQKLPGWLVVRSLWRVGLVS